MSRAQGWQRVAAVVFAVVLGAAALPPRAARAAVPAGWAKEVIAPSSRNTYPREVRATVLDGKPSVFFYSYDGPAASHGLKLAQRDAGGAWSVSTVLPGASAGVWMDYAASGRRGHERQAELPMVGLACPARPRPTAGGGGFTPRNGQ